MGAEQKASASNFTLKMGEMTAMLDVVPVRRINLKKETGLKSVCPTCFSSLEGCQCYICPSSHGPFKQADLRKARKDASGNMVVLTKEEVEATKDKGAAGMLELRVCDRAELAEATRPDTDQYRLRVPTRDEKGKPLGAKVIKSLTEQYKIFAAMAQHPTRVLYGVGRISGGANTGGFMLTLWRGQLTLQSLVRPQDLADPDETPEPLDSPKMLGMIDQLVERSSAPVDTEMFTDQRKAALEAIMAAKASGEEMPVELPEVEVDDLMTSLEKALQASLDKVAAKTAA